MKPKTIKMQFKTDTHVKKTGVMLVGMGGNNGWYVQFELLSLHAHLQ